MTQNILILEDERNVALTLMERLKGEGYQVQWCATVKTAEQFSLENSYDLALVDVGLPDGNGFDFARGLRVKNPKTSILFLTAYADPDHRVIGLEIGAEDYVTKPFHFQELLIRIRNVLKRNGNLQSNAIRDPVTLGEALVSFSKLEIRRDHEMERLTHKEASLLKLLLDKEGTVVSRDEILDTIWSESEYPTPRTVDNFILKLRKWIEKNPHTPKIILSIRGVGYQLKRENHS